MARGTIREADGRLPVDEILADHMACLHWYEMGRALRKDAAASPGKRGARSGKVAALMAPHQDVIEAATACVAGKGHH